MLVCVCDIGGGYKTRVLFIPIHFTYSLRHAPTVSSFQFSVDYVGCFGAMEMCYKIPHSCIGGGVAAATAAGLDDVLAPIHRISHHAYRRCIGVYFVFACEVFPNFFLCDFCSYSIMTVFVPFFAHFAHEILD